MRHAGQGSLSGEVTLEPNINRAGRRASGGGTASAKALGHKHAQCVQGVTRDESSWSEERGREVTRCLTHEAHGLWHRGNTCQLLALGWAFPGGRPGQGPRRDWHNSLSVCLSVHSSAGSVALRASTLAPRCRGEKAIWRFLPFLSFPCSSRRTPGHTWHLGARVGPGRWGSLPRALRARLPVWEAPGAQYLIVPAAPRSFLRTWGPRPEVPAISGAG